MAQEVRSPHRLIYICAAAIIADYIPVMRLPFVWCETFFHEISHGLMAIITGGSIVSLTLNYDGSGLCVSQGGLLLLISFAGYFGSVVWGGLIYLLSDHMNPRYSHMMMGMLITMLLLVLVMWADKVSTYIILGAMIVLFSAMFKFADSLLLKTLLQFIGVFVLLDAVRSPMALIDGLDRGDGWQLADITLLPEFVWIGIWLLSGLTMLFILFRVSYK